MVTPQARIAEEEIEAYCRTQALTKRKLSDALWHLLLVCEDRLISGFEEAMGASTFYRRIAAGQTTDTIINEIKAPIGWLYEKCPTGRQSSIPNLVSQVLIQEAKQLLLLSSEYMDVETVFTYGSYEHRDLLTVDAADHIVTATGIMRNGEVCDAYDRLIPTIKPEKDADSEFIDELESILKVSHSSFTYKPSPGFYRSVVQQMQPLLGDLLDLPDTWDFSAFSGPDFVCVAKHLYAIATIHAQARVIAVRRGCKGGGLKSAILIRSRKELSSTISRESGVAPEKVDHILRMLTWGEDSQGDPDPALQPLLPIGSSLLLAPSILLSTSMQRNFIALVNRIPRLKKIYQKLSRDHEQRSKEQFIQGLPSGVLRTWSGYISSWESAAEIDLLLIDDKNRVCLLLELKAFLAPADPREIINKSKEIERGIEQIRVRKEAYATHPSALREAGQFTSDYKMYFAVGTENSIGASYVQANDVPVINLTQLARKLKACQSLAVVGEWLQQRSYLPKEGRDFDKADRTAKIGTWSVEWYGIVFKSNAKLPDF